MSNQGPSSPIKYYPDANSGKGGYMPNTGAGRPGKVRLKPKWDKVDRGIEKVRKSAHYG